MEAPASATRESLDDRRQSLHHLVANGDVRDAELLAAPLQGLNHLIDRARQCSDRAGARQALSRATHLTREPARALPLNCHQIQIELDLVESRAGSLADPSDPFGDPGLGLGG